MKSYQYQKANFSPGRISSKCSLTTWEQKFVYSTYSSRACHTPCLAANTLVTRTHYDYRTTFPDPTSRSIDISTHFWRPRLGSLLSRKLNFEDVIEFRSSTVFTPKFDENTSISWKSICGRKCISTQGNHSLIFKHHYVFLRVVPLVWPCESVWLALMVRCYCVLLESSVTVSVHTVTSMYGSHSCQRYVPVLQYSYCMPFESCHLISAHSYQYVR